jgi:hypothetical protein
MYESMTCDGVAFSGIMSIVMFHNNWSTGSKIEMVWRVEDGRDLTTTHIHMSVVRVYIGRQSVSLIVG